jgi:hypothetical protein
MLRLGIIVVVLAVIALFAFRGKPALDSFMATDISQLLTSVTEHDGKVVTVKGTVQESAAVLGLGGYRLRQGNAEIFVLSSHGIPQTGTEVVVTGTFKQAFALNGLQYTVIVERK